MENIFISGISSGIGKGLALYYANQGVKVYGISRRLLDYNHENITHAQLDILNYQQTPFVIDKFLKGHKLDLVILNAGILGTMSSMKQADLDEMKAVMETNLWSQKVLLDSLIDSCKMKNVIAISSGAAVNGNMGWSGYSLSKAALNMLIQLYAKEDLDTKYIALAPGLVDTAMQDYICGEVSGDDFPSVKRLQQARGTENMPTPDEFAKKFNSALERICSLDSGSFIDIRSL